MNSIVDMFNSFLRLIGWVVVLLFAIKVLCIWYNSPKRKGARGERRIAARLRRGLPDEYKLLNDVYLPLPDGTTTQVDHIIVSQYGVFVAESKTYSGWIFGDEKSTQWMQTIYRKKSRFQNPLRQNFRHICALAGALGIDKSYFHSVAVFDDKCKFMTEMPENVVYIRQAAAYIRGFDKPIIKASQVSELADAISEWQGTVGEKRKSRHVANLKKRHSTVREGDVPACPYCGGRMVLRTRKKDGVKFYGCESYPACRGIVNVA